MATESDSATPLVNVVLDKPSDWHNWIFFRKDAAQINGLWKYVNPDTAADQLPQLKEPVEPQFSAYKEGAESFGSLSTTDQELFKWEYERYSKRYTEWSEKRMALADFNLEISTTVATRHLYLLWGKSTPYERLVTLKQRFAPTDATRRRELLDRYAALQTKSWSPSSSTLTSTNRGRDRRFREDV